MWASLLSSTAFLTLRRRQHFPFCTIEPNVGVITVPDERLTKLAEIVHPGRIVPATCEIVDIRLNCTEGEVGCLRLSVRKADEESRLAHIGKSYNTTF